MRDFIECRGIKINDRKRPPVCQCPNPGHADEDPSAVIYDENIHCPVCSETWDIFEVAGLLDGLTDFPDKLKAVENTLGMTNTQSRQKSSSSKSKPVHKHVPLERERALVVFKPEILLARAKSAKWLEGTPRLITPVWPYYNADGLIDILDARFENDDGKKAVITFYYDGKTLRSAGAPVLIYGRDKLAADTEKPVLIVEGAKTAEAANAMGDFISITWNGGGKKCKKVDWDILKDRTVFIYPDDDQKCYGEKHNQAGQLLPFQAQPGISTAFEIKKLLPNAKVIQPLEAARKIKADGADIVEALQVMNAQELAEYILSAPELTPPSNPIDTPSRAQDADFFPFRILGVADDGKGYFLDRHERLTSMSLGSITQNKLLTLASLTYWQGEFATAAKGTAMSRDDWTSAIDAVIQMAGQIDFNPDRIRGRGAWREKDGRICYHDGLTTTGVTAPERLYLRMTRKDIGLDSPMPDLNALTTILNVAKKLSFETWADMIRCLGWSTLAPFAGALPWRPAGFLTGRSESGKSTIVDMLIKPLSLPFVFSGGETTEAGVRQTIKNDATAIIIEEAETDTPKKRQRRDDILSLMRQSTSDETPKAAKGTIDGKGMMFTLRSMFMFVAISPEVESIADDNRLFRINLEKNDNDWATIKAQLGEAITPEICASVRAMTWIKLNDIFALADKMSPVIQKITNKSARYALAEAMLFAAYQIVWKQVELTEENLHAFFEQIYEWQPPEEGRDETDELLDRLLDESVQEGKDRYTLRVVLQKSALMDNVGHWKSIAGRYGLGITPDGHLAIAKNHHAIARIIERGRGYQRMFKRHLLLVEYSKSVGIGGKVRNCLIIDKSILTEEGDVF